MTSPAHGFNRVYSIPMRKVEPSGFGKAKVGDPWDDTYATYEIDYVKWNEEMEDHQEEESGDPTSEQIATSALYSRAAFLVVFGEEHFTQLEMSEADRSAVRTLVEKYK